MPACRGQWGSGVGGAAGSLVQQPSGSKEGQGAGKEGQGAGQRPGPSWRPGGRMYVTSWWLWLAGSRCGVGGGGGELVPRCSTGGGLPPTCPVLPGTSGTLTRPRLPRGGEGRRGGGGRRGEGGGKEGGGPITTAPFATAHWAKGGRGRQGKARPPTRVAKAQARRRAPVAHKGQGAQHDDHGKWNTRASYRSAISRRSSQGSKEGKEGLGLLVVEASADRGLTNAGPSSFHRATPPAPQFLVQQHGFLLHKHGMHP